MLIDLCHKELREHLELKQDDMRSEYVRTDTINYIERTRDLINSQVKAMDVDNVENGGHDSHAQEWEEWVMILFRQLQPRPRVYMVMCPGDVGGWVAEKQEDSSSLTILIFQANRALNRCCNETGHLRLEDMQGGT